MGSRCDKCGAAVSVNEWNVCAYCERIAQALYASLRSRMAAS